MANRAPSLTTSAAPTLASQLLPWIFALQGVFVIASFVAGIVLGLNEPLGYRDVLPVLYLITVAFTFVLVTLSPWEWRRLITDLVAVPVILILQINGDPLVGDLVVIRLVVASAIGFGLQIRKRGAWPEWLKRPIPLLFTIYLSLILLASLLLTLAPMVNHFEVFSLRERWFRALFDATAAGTATGMSVEPLAERYTWAGQLVMLILIQTAGMGVKLLTIWIVYVSGKHFGSLEKRFARTMLLEEGEKDLISIMRYVVISTLIIEGLGAVVISAFLWGDLPLREAVFSGVFHSVSAFTNCGHILFRDESIMMAEYPVVVVTMLILIFIGGIGFNVLATIFAAAGQRLRPPQKRTAQRFITTHAKVVVVSFLFIMVVGSGLMWAVENALGTPASGASHVGWVLATVVSRSTGFEWLDTSALTSGGIAVLLALMLVGTGSGSMGGGLKVNTFFVLLVNVRSTVFNRPHQVFRRSLPDGLFIHSGLLFFMYVLLLLVSILGFMALQPDDVDRISFDVASALANAGMSAGYVKTLDDAERLLLALVMLLGRVIPVWFSLLLTGRDPDSEKRRKSASLLIG